MNFFLLSFGLYDYDGRLKELKKMFDSMGHVDMVCFSSSEERNSLKSRGTHYSITNFIRFLFRALISYLGQRRKVDALVVDNCYAAWVGYILCLFNKNSYLIYDMRELYIDYTGNNLKLKAILYFEKKIIERSTCILVANKYRKDEVIKRFDLIGEVMVFENIRFLSGDDKKEPLIGNIPYSSSNINVVSTGGFSISRGADYLVSQFLKLPDNYKLYIVGSGKDEFLSIYDNLNVSDKVYFVDKMPMPELKGFISLMDLGIVHYSFDDINNILCASGKVYEYIGEGLPVVTTEHLTLKDFCNNSRAGVCDNDFVDAIEEVARNINEYKKNATSYASKFEVVNYTKVVSNKIERDIFKL